MNKIMEKVDSKVSEAISEGLQKLKKAPPQEKPKEGVNLLEITKKLSEKKFGKKK
jgi:hypothetical protein